MAFRCEQLHGEPSRLRKALCSASSCMSVAEIKAELPSLSPAELAKFRDKMKPVVDKHGAASPEATKDLLAELAKLRK